MPGGSAGTSFCSGTEISINLRAMALPHVLFRRMLRASREVRQALPVPPI
jgi:hypothetical protein